MTWKSPINQKNEIQKLKKYDVVMTNQTQDETQKLNSSEGMKESLNMEIKEKLNLEIKEKLKSDLKEKLNLEIKEKLDMELTNQSPDGKLDISVEI